ncbi:hypothetical protein AB0M92_18735 [Streptomyces sp. NPDC051582]|uniref:hypothetical protein n=1 Tax=Streptomyces sp. NPDC051582 TaxID=3155167 RepID=UPI00341C6E22
MNDRVLPAESGNPNPTAREQLLSFVSGTVVNGYFVSKKRANALLDAYRAEVVAEAIEAARSEYLTDATGTDEDNDYNNGITDAVAAIGALLEAGESRG